MEKGVVVTFNRVNGAPIKILDNNTNNWVEYGEHPQFGFDYYVITTEQYIIPSLFLGREVEIISTEEFKKRRKDDMYEGAYVDVATGKLKINNPGFIGPRIKYERSHKYNINH